MYERSHRTTELSWRYDTNEVDAKVMEVASKSVTGLIFIAPAPHGNLCVAKYSSSCGGGLKEAVTMFSPAV
jgi:hypothetical protein